MKIKTLEYNLLKFNYNSILFGSISSCIFILNLIPTQAMFKTTKNLSGSSYGKNVRELVNFFENAGTNASTTLSKTSSILKTNSEIKTDSEIKTQTSSLTKTLPINKKTYVSKLHIPISGKSSASNLTNNKNNNSNNNKNVKSQINTAKYNDIFGIYTSASTTIFENDKTTTSAKNFKSKYNSHTDKTSTKSNSKNNTSSSTTLFKLDLKFGGNPNLTSLTYSEKRLKNLESQIKVFTASVIKENLPKGSSGKVELKFDQKLNKDLNLVLSKFVYKSAMDSINGYLNNKNN